MMKDKLYTSCLYNAIIVKNAKNCHHLRVITGYGSGSFLRKINQEFPYLKIQVFIGMAQQGISESDHRIYQELTNEGQIEVYYHHDKNYNHQKVYEFVGETTIGYLGSANFSENGFGKQKEVLLQTEADLAPLFTEESNHCTICNSPLITELVKIVKNNQVEGLEIEPKTELISDDDDNLKSIDENSKLFANHSSYHGIGINIPLIPNDDLWNVSGINVSELTLLSTYDLDLPGEFELIFNDNHYQAKLINFRNIKLIDGDLKQLIASSLGINPQELITKEQLESLNKTHVELIDLGDNQFNLQFSN